MLNFGSNILTSCLQFTANSLWTRNLTQFMLPPPVRGTNDRSNFKPSLSRNSAWQRRFPQQI